SWRRNCFRVLADGVHGPSGARFRVLASENRRRLMSFDLLTPVRTYVNGVEADLARTALEAAGIHAVVRRDDCGGVRPSLWLLGIQLLVRPEDVAAADAVLGTPALYVADAEPESVAPTPSAYEFR